MEGPSRTKRGRTKMTAARPRVSEEEQAPPERPRRPRPNPAKRIDYSRLFNNPIQLCDFSTKFLNRKLLDPHYMDCDYFINQGFHFAELVKAQGLMQFVSLNNAYYEMLVRAFYCNAEIENGNLTSIIAGKEITVSAELWEAVTGLKMEGHTYNKQRLREIPNYNMIEAQRDMLLDPSEVPRGRDIKVGLLKMEDRLLHYVITKMVNPKLGNFTRVSTEETFLIWAFKNQFKINWPLYMMEKIEKAHRDETCPLPYACLVSMFVTVFQAFTIDDGLTAVPTAHEFGTTTLTKMGIDKSRDGIWSYKVTSEQGQASGSGHQNYDSGNEPDSPPAEQAEPAPTMPNYDQFYSVEPPWFTAAMGTMNENFGQLNLRLTRIEDHLHITPNEDSDD